MTLKSQLIALTPIAIAVVGLLGYNFMSAQWQAPTATAPNNNTDAPINVSANYQLKQGDLGAVRMRAGYYCDASGSNCFTLPITVPTSTPTCVNRTGGGSVSCLAGEVAMGGGCVDNCGGGCTAKAITTSVPTANGWSCVTNNTPAATVRCCRF